MGTYKLSYTGQEVNSILGTAKTLSAKVADLEGALDSLPSSPEGSPIAGIVYPFAGETVPEGFLMCDGEAYSRDEYAELFEAIGTTYGEGDGATTFNVPDLQTRVPVGAGVDYELGEVGGEEEHKLIEGELPKLSGRAWFRNWTWGGDSQGSTFLSPDGILKSESGGSTGYDMLGYGSAQGGSTILKAEFGGDQPHNNMQPYTVVNYIISTGKSADARPMTISETTVQSSAVAGMVYPFAGEGDPEGFLLCDGSEYSRTEYAKLFDAIGTTYGSGDGSTTFNVPNLESRVIIGESDGYALGETGGEEKHTLTVDEMPEDYASFTVRTVWGANAIVDSTGANVTNVSGDYSYLTVDSVNAGDAKKYSFTGEGESHNNMQPYVVMRYFISTGEGGVTSGGTASGAVYGINPADYVVEWGQTDGWYWEKWASGKAECWAVLFEENNEPYSTWNNMPFRYTPMWEFPIEFIDVPSVSYAGYIGSGYAIDARAEATKDWVRLFFATSATGSEQVEAHIQARGFWKDSPTSGGVAVGHFNNATVENDLEVSGTLTVDGREYGVNKVLWSGGHGMNETQTITLSEAISSQPNGVILVWSAYSDGAAKNYYWEFTQVPKYHVEAHNGTGMSIHLAANNFGVAAYKYLYVSDTSITGADTNNDSGADSYAGINYTNSYFVLRYVIGY